MFVSQENMYIMSTGCVASAGIVLLCMCCISCDSVTVWVLGRELPGSLAH